MITVHILTKNNAKTLLKTFESIYSLNSQVLVGDYGSTDETLDICRRFNAKIFNVKDMPRNEARDHLAKQSNGNWNLWIEPWEIVLGGIKNFENLKEDYGYARILNENILNWEIRLWKNKVKFINPIFENIDSDVGQDSSLILGSYQENFQENIFDILNQWKEQEPLSNKPYYYQSCILLAQSKYEDFLRVSDHYLFLNKKIELSTIMTRYYQSLVYIIKFKSVKYALKNLNLCLSQRPLMAEFWCATGDVYYHLLKNFELAKEFYENAIILGSNRLKFDKWPMDISKYNKYPRKMIDSCDYILKNNADYKKI